MKTYMPTNLINQNYRYRISGDYYVVIKNTNCTTNYNTTYCDCVNVFPKLDYLESETYQCSYTSNSSNYIAYTNFTDDFYYRIDIANVLLIFLILFLFIIRLPFRLISRVFGRWLKL